jgi:lysozyme family protein
MTASNFARSLALVFKWEGGYVFHPRDPGGATNMGITKATLEHWRGKSVSVEDVKRLTKVEAGLIYRARYWDVVKGDSLPAGLDYALFDYAVNSGPYRAIKHLQTILRVRVDGVIGPETLGAVRAADVAGTVSRLLDKRLAWLRSLVGWSTFAKGWTNRVADVRAEALAMAGMPPPLPPTPKPPLVRPSARQTGIVAVIVGVVVAAWLWARDWITSLFGFFVD